MLIDFEQIKYFLEDARYFKLFPKRYKTTWIEDRKEREVYWRDVRRRYNNFRKRVDCSIYHWYVITYKDGRKELAYFSIWRMVDPHAGRLCRGLLFPRFWGTDKFEHTVDISVAF